MVLVIFKDCDTIVVPKNRGVKEEVEQNPVQQPHVAIKHGEKVIRNEIGCVFHAFQGKISTSQ